MNEIKIIHKPTTSEPFVVFYKPSGLPSAPLFEKDQNNALFKISRIYPEVLKVSGKKEIEHGLIHRIDGVTEGLLLAAVSQEFYDEILIRQKNKEFIKTYLCKCKKNLENAEKLTGFPDFDFYKNDFLKDEFEISSFFRPFGKGRKEVRPVLINGDKKSAIKKSGNKIYTTKVKILQNKDDVYDIQCKIYEGYRHQVRCHLAWCGFPILNDRVYNFEQKFLENCEKIQFVANGLEFVFAGKKYSYAGLKPL